MLRRCGCAPEKGAAPSSPDAHAPLPLSFQGRGLENETNSEDGRRGGLALLKSGPVRAPGWGGLWSQQPVTWRLSMLTDGAGHSHSEARAKHLLGRELQGPWQMHSRPLRAACSQPCPCQPGARVCSQPLGRLT